MMAEKRDSEGRPILGVSGTALRILRRKQVVGKTGIPSSSLYAMMDRGEFPRPIRLSKKAVGWPEHIVDAWIQERIKASAG